MCLHFDWRLGPMLGHMDGFSLKTCLYQYNGPFILLYCSSYIQYWINLLLAHICCGLLCLNIITYHHHLEFDCHHVFQWCFLWVVKICWNWEWVFINIFGCNLFTHADIKALYAVWGASEAAESKETSEKDVAKNIIGCTKTFPFLTTKKQQKNALDAFKGFLNHKNKEMVSKAFGCINQGHFDALVSDFSCGHWFVNLFTSCSWLRFLQLNISIWQGWK